MPYTPEQNGCAERDNRTIVEAARAMMHAHEQLPQGLWAELANTAVYILNRTGPTKEYGNLPLSYGMARNLPLSISELSEVSAMPIFLKLTGKS